MSAELARAQHCIEMANRLNVSAELARANHCLEMSRKLRARAAAARISDDPTRWERLMGHAQEYDEVARANIDFHEART